MRLTPACLSLLLLAINTSVAGTALEALKFLTPEQIQRVALIAGRDGTPQPDRWHVVVFDPASKETGLREIVVSGGRKVADRSISQFVEKLSANDVISPDALKVDSDKLEKLAMKFGSANSTMVSALHFDLRRTGPESGALWTVTCLDSSGTELGKLIVSATRGNVLLHPGFVAEPDVDTIAEGLQATPRPGDTLEPGDPRALRRATPPVRRRPQPTPFTGTTPKPGFLQRLFTPDKNKPPPR
jgi:hypothetical protein